jgi:hypothetical protein
MIMKAGTAYCFSLDRGREEGRGDFEEDRGRLKKIE